MSTLHLFCLVIEVLQGPQAPAVVEAEGDRFPDVRLGHKGFHLEALRHGHLGDGLGGLEELCVARGGRGPKG